jgi:hypothetical protein
MKHLSLSFLSLLLIGVPTLVAAAPYTITLEGRDLADLNRVKNCIDYSVCAKVTSSIFQDFFRSMMIIQVDLTKSEQKKVAQECLAENQNRFRTVMRNALFLPIEIPSKAASTDAGKKSPALLKTLSNDDRNQIEKHLTSLIERKEFDAATLYVTDAYAIDLNGYQVTIGRTGSADAEQYAVTSHSDKTIEIGLGFFNHRCELINVIRHEAEHVAQWKRSQECRAKGRRSAYDDHLYRERSAYLNDILNSRMYCSDLKYRSEIEADRYQALFQKYGNQRSSQGLIATRPF